MPSSDFGSRGHSQLSSKKSFQSSQRIMTLSPSLLLKLILITISVICLTSVHCVDRSNFKTCEQSGFCRRHRNQEVGSSPWVLLAESMKQSNDPQEGIEAHLRNVKNGIMLKMLVRGVNDGRVVRITIDELNGLRRRYDAREALLDDIKYIPLKVLSHSEKGFTVEVTSTDESGQPLKHRVEFWSQPFRIDVYRQSDNRLLISANHRGLMKFEHFRQKVDHGGEEQEGEKPEGQAEQNNEIDDCTDGCWEESFKSHHDSKPYGPMSVGMDFSFIGFEHVYGIPEHADRFPLKDTKGKTDPYRLYNVDIFEYEMETPMSLYGAVPLMVAHSVDSSVGLFWLNAAETWIDIETQGGGVVGMLSNLVSGEPKTRHTHWMSETGLIDAWLLLGPRPTDVMKQYAKLTGTTHMPPYYSIGYHQCRWNYYSQDEVMGVDIGFDDHDIPMDAIWLDIEYTAHRSKMYFTWDSSTFADPKTLTANLTTKGRRLITIIDPHLKKDNSYHIYNEAASKNYLIKDKSGNDYEGWCWPGASFWPDYLNPEVQQWWAEKFSPAHFPGFEGGLVDIWNDMNEPSVFNGPEVSAPRDVRHYGDLEHRDIHNIYGMLMTKATYDGHMKYRPEVRSFILTRSFFAGSQRYCAAWTGDNMSKWTHLQIVTPMVLSLSIAGITFSGADVPGFFFNPESEELVVRWYQAAAFHTFYRGHAHHDTRRREPWFFAPETKHLIREAIRIRYEYLPYMYTLFRENELNGVPPVRPLWMHFEKDVNTFGIDDAFLLGEHMLVHPVVQAGATSQTVYFPRSSANDFWYDIDTHQIYNGGSSVSVPAPLDKLPFFHRSGSIIPKRYRMRRSAVFTLNDPVSLEIVPNKDGEAHGSLYLDDGQTNKYLNGDYLQADITYQRKTLTYKIVDGSHHTKVWLEKVVIYQFSSKPQRVEARLNDDSSGVSLQFKYDPDSQMLVIRKPGFNLAQNWTIKIVA